MQTVVELPSYCGEIDRLLPENVSMAIIQYIAANPEAGELIVGTGGVRKLRWARPGRGKSSGVRVVYYFYTTAMPIFMLAVFGKNEKVNLSRSERNELKKIVVRLRKHYGG